MWGWSGWCKGFLSEVQLMSISCLTQGNMPNWIILNVFSERESFLKEIGNDSMLGIKGLRNPHDDISSWAKNYEVTLIRYESNTVLERVVRDSLCVHTHIYNSIKCYDTRLIQACYLYRWYSDHGSFVVSDNTVLSAHLLKDGSGVTVCFAISLLVGRKKSWILWNQGCWIATGQGERCILKMRFIPERLGIR